MRFPIGLMMGVAVACGPANDGGSDDPTESVADTGDIVATGGDGGSAGDETGEPPPGSKLLCSTLESGATLGGEPLNPLGFPPPCDPANQSGGESEYLCCSDDPAAVGGALPAYDGFPITGDTPLFSADANAMSRWGQCVRTADTSTMASIMEAAAMGCPVPCNPTWDAGSITEVCGTGRVCCQTQELQPEDCVEDPEGSGQWRPVTGEDIGVSTDWNPTAHTTHQDPSGTACTIFAGGDSASPEFEDCVRQLGVASSRGYCMALGEMQCPHASADYLDACEQITMGLISPPA